MTLKDYYENAKFNFGKGYKDPCRHMGLGMIKNYERAKLMGAKDTDLWSEWLDKATPDLTEFRENILKELKKEEENENG